MPGGLVIDAPGWPGLLSLAACIAVGLEFVGLVVWIIRGRPGAAGPGRPVLIIAAAGGPVTAVGAAAWGLARWAGGDKFTAGAVLRAGLKGAFAELLALAVALELADGGQRTAEFTCLAVLAVSAIAWLVRSYGRTTAPLSRPARIMLLSLRIAAVLLACCWALHPRFEYVAREQIRQTVLLGVDVSASMRRADMPRPYSSPTFPEGQAPQRRIDAVRQAIQQNHGRLEDIAKHADLELFAFDGSVRNRTAFKSGGWTGPTGINDAVGTMTAIGDSLAGAFEPLASSSRQIAAAIIISDGCNNTAARYEPQRFASVLALRASPVFTVGAGWPKPTGSVKALSVKSISAPQEIGAFNRLTARSVVEAVGLKGVPVRVTCTFGTEQIGQAELVPDSDLWIGQPEFTHVPLVSGFHRLTVAAEVVGKPPPGLSGRPLADMLVHVVDKHIRILYIEGKFRYEIKYVKRALEADPRNAVDSRVLLASPGQDRPSPLGDKLDDWLTYHAIILGDVGADKFTAVQRQIMKDLVGKYGKGLCMIGGSRAFGAGGWDKTVLNDIMPVDLAGSTNQLEGPLKIAVTEDGLACPIMKIDPDKPDVRQAWAELPDLLGANKLTGIKPGATLLASDAAGNPLIAIQQYGSGRTAAIAFDTTYQWVLSPKDTGEMQKRFWRQAAIYLAQPKGNVWIHADRPSYDLDRLAAGTETVSVSAGVEDASGKPVRGGVMDVKMVAPDGKQTPLALRQEDRMCAGTPPSPQSPGVYKLQIAAQVEGAAQSAEYQFEVVRRDLEAMDALANFDLLSQTAKAGGGRFVPLAELPELLDDLERISEPKERAVVNRREVWQHLGWPILIIILCLLAAEWMLRKRKSLV
ncbi:MAG: hypothetical protein HZA50_01065 [Planctomycetes bacterium]|nr:hypothetical protein [Planctomycetota bacterium]